MANRWASPAGFRPGLQLPSSKACHARTISAALQSPLAGRDVVRHDSWRTMAATNGAVTQGGGVSPDELPAFVIAINPSTFPPIVLQNDRTRVAGTLPLTATKPESDLTVELLAPVE